MLLALMLKTILTEHPPECLSIVQLAQRTYMAGKWERVDLELYISIVITLAGGESATYPDKQRSPGFAGKHSVGCHGVF